MNTEQRSSVEVFDGDQMLHPFVILTSVLNAGEQAAAFQTKKIT